MPLDDIRYLTIRYALNCAPTPKIAFLSATPEE